MGMCLCVCACVLCKCPILQCPICTVLISEDEVELAIISHNAASFMWFMAYDLSKHLCPLTLQFCFLWNWCQERC